MDGDGGLRSYTDAEHVRERPGMYTGSVVEEKREMLCWSIDAEGGLSCQMKCVSFIPALSKIFDEALSNALDAAFKDPSVRNIKVTISDSSVTVWNDGGGIICTIHSKLNVPVPQAAFGNFKTSSNYDDSKDRVVAGLNGLGIKLTNIFSDLFSVKIRHGETGDTYEQTWSNRMEHMSAPKFKAGSKPMVGFVSVSFTPIASLMHDGVFTDDVKALFVARVVEIALCAPKHVKVYVGVAPSVADAAGAKAAGKKRARDPEDEESDKREKLDDGSGASKREKLLHVVKCNTMKKYMALVCPGSDFMAVDEANPNWIVGVAHTAANATYGMVNGASCPAGAHIKYVRTKLMPSIVKTISNKRNSGKVVVTNAAIDAHATYFVVARVNKPMFDSQTKEKLVSYTGLNAYEPSDKFVEDIASSPIATAALAEARGKQAKELKKTDGSKKSKLSGIPKLDDANEAGTRNSAKCTLILTEGDSAKALAVSGLSVVGRNYYGVFPLRGKLINVRSATHDQIMNNHEIVTVKKIVGLQHGKEYDDVSTLRYGRIMIMTDQDHDGSHIKGLLINWLHAHFPSLLKIPGFLVEFITPIVKVSKGSQRLSFYTMPEYEEWQKANPQGWAAKYYKGLGTSTAAEAKEYFSAIQQNTKTFKWTNDEDGALIDMAFSKQRADDRKKWLAAFVPGTFLDHSIREIKYDEFINKELILFSMADNIRSIPNVLDGLKPSQRKVLFGAFKRRLKADVKVAQLGGYVSEHAAYHHGEASLSATIVNMACDYVSSNNVNLLVPSGQFGTRHQGGEDHASPRYIFTRLCEITRCIFPEEDDALLQHQFEDGERIEPVHYMPIVPMVLVNGSSGIGTGYSTDIPMYSLADVVAQVRRQIAGLDPEAIHVKYRGFTGAIEEENRTYTVRGAYKVVDETTIEITELPIRVWTQTYKAFLEDLMTGSPTAGKSTTPAGKADPTISSFTEFHTDTKVHFVVKLPKEKLAQLVADGAIEKKFKLSAKVSTGNMRAFDADGKMVKYACVEDILKAHFGPRRAMYVARKEMLLDRMQTEMAHLSNRARFITAKIDGSLVIEKRKRAEIEAQLRAEKYDPVDGSYSYLLSMTLDCLTEEKVRALKAEVEKKRLALETLRKTTPDQMWLADLDALMVAHAASEAAAAGGSGSGFGAGSGSGSALAKPRGKKK